MARSGKIHTAVKQRRHTEQYLLTLVISFSRAGLRSMTSRATPLPALLTRRDAALDMLRTDVNDSNNGAGW